MMQFDTNVAQSLQQAAVHLEKGDHAAVKRTYFEALQKSPQQVQVRELLRSTVHYQRNVDLSNFANEFEQVVTQLATHVVTSATGGWLYSIAIDKAFLNGDLKIVRPSAPAPAKPNVSEPLGNRDAAQMLTELLAIPDIQARWKAVSELANSNERVLREDSFAGMYWDELPDAIISGQKPEGLNIVILGGGCVGLALANALKWTFRDRLDVLVIENRVEAIHRKRPYDRHWLTHIPNSVLTGIYDPDVTELLAQFGRPGFMGASLAIFETLLLISNKKLGVRFLFDDDYDLSFLEKSHTHLVFDATGGRFEPPQDGLTKGTLDDGPASLTVNTQALQQFGRGHHAHGIVNSENVPAMQLEIRKTEPGYYRPIYNGAPLRTALFKLTHVPIGLYERLLDYVRPQNADGLFYIWPGNLRPELNEILALINLNQAGASYLASLVPQKTGLASCVEQGLLQSDALDPRIIEFVKFLQSATDDFDQIGIEPPFLFEPRLQWLSAKFDRLWGKVVVPVGDTVMTGNPKSGNGLGSHLNRLLLLHDTTVLLYGHH